MTHYLLHAFPTLALLSAVGLGLTVAVFEVSEASRELVADVRLAMKRRDLSLDYVARCISVPPCKLSDQLNGKVAFTAFWRFVTTEIKATGFWDELLAIRAERSGGVYVRGSLAALVRGVEKLVAEKERKSA